MIAVIRPVLAKERLAKLFYHKNTFAGQAGTENRFDQELITDSALALANLKKPKQNKTTTKLIPKTKAKKVTILLKICLAIKNACNL